MSSIFIQWSASGHDSLAPDTVDILYHLFDECNNLEPLLNEAFGVEYWVIVPFQ